MSLKLPYFIDMENKVVYIHCSSAITAMGIPSFLKKNFPGYEGKLVSKEYLEKLNNK